MNRKLKLQILFWISCLILYFSTFTSYQRFYVVNVLDKEIFCEFMTSTQKMLFNNTIIYVIFLYLKKEEFLNTEAMIRYKRKPLFPIWLSCIVNSITFTFGMYAIWFIIAIFKNIHIDFLILNSAVKIFAYCLKLGAVYLSIYVLSKKYIYSIFFIIIESLVLLIAYIGLGFVGLDILIVINILLNPCYCLFVAIILLGISSISIKKRDYL